MKLRMSVLVCKCVCVCVQIKKPNEASINAKFNIFVILIASRSAAAANAAHVTQPVRPIPDPRLTQSPPSALAFVCVQ